MRPTDISATVRRKVLERDSMNGAPCCIFCGSPHDIELAHFVSRGSMGKGIPENLVCLCVKCHRTMDAGSNKRSRNEIRHYVREYLQLMYPGWDENLVVYHKYPDPTWPKCPREDCFANDRGSCGILTETTDSENCAFYKEKT